MAEPAAPGRALDGAAIYVLGAGGHAKVVVDAIRAMGLGVAGLSDRAPGIAQVKFPDVEIVDDEALLGRAAELLMMANGVGGAGDTAPRRRLFEKFKSRGFRFLTVVHPSAIVAPDVVLGEGVQIMAGAVVQPGARIGANTIVNTRAVVDHDCDVGAHCHIASGAVLASTVTVGEGAHIGAGATVIQLVRIGAGALVGAGAAVIRDVPSGARALGVPAKIA